jgi:hypothetical protein
MTAAILDMCKDDGGIEPGGFGFRYGSGVEDNVATE